MPSSARTPGKDFPTPTIRSNGGTAEAGESTAIT
jgi:hypothetical protein